MNVHVIPYRSGLFDRDTNDIVSVAVGIPRGADILFIEGLREHVVDLMDKFGKDEGMATGTIWLRFIGDTP